MGGAFFLIFQTFLINIFQQYSFVASCLLVGDNLNGIIPKLGKSQYFFNNIFYIFDRRRLENACTDDGMHFTHKLIFDLDRKYVPKAEVIIHVLQVVGDK